MTKFHVNGKGEPGPCTAKEGNCPFGGEEEHHDSMEAARIAGEEKLESEHGNLPKHRSEPKSKLSNAELESKFSEDSVHSFPAGEYYLVHGGDNFRETPGVEDGVEFKDWDEEDKFYEDSVKELDAVAQPLARNRDYHGYNWRVHLVPKDKVSSLSPAVKRYVEENQSYLDVESKTPFKVVETSNIEDEKGYGNAEIINELAEKGEIKVGYHPADDGSPPELGEKTTIWTAGSGVMILRDGEKPLVHTF